MMSSAFVPDLVSVIVPVHNRRHLVLEALGSVVAQTWRPIELIVVDDGSTDGTADAVEAWLDALSPGQRDGLVLRLVSQEQAGAQRARNHGLSLSRGEFIQFLDSDDLLHPDKLRRHTDALRGDPEAVYAYSSWRRVDGRAPKTIAGVLGSAVSCLPELYMSSLGLHTMAGVYRREVCLEIGPWNEAIKRYHDIEYNLRMVSLRRRMIFVKGIYATYRQHATDRITTTVAGTEDHIEATDRLSRLLTSRALGSEPAREAVARMYHHACVQAARTDRLDVARAACAKARGHAQTPGRRLRLRLMQVLCSPVMPGALRRAYFRHVHGIRGALRARLWRLAWVR